MIAAFLLLLPSFEITANPNNYQGAVVVLGPGDTLRLEAGVYRDCLHLVGLHGTEDAPIVVTGPAKGRAVFKGAACDGWTNRQRVVVKVERSSHLTIQNLEIDCEGHAVDGVEAGYGNSPVHHLTLQNLYIHDNAVSNQQNGISSFAVAWDWKVRNNWIENVGTGLYLGNSTGRDPFIRGVIEDNVILNPRGYGIQVKHQRARPSIRGMPTAPAETIIRGNLIAKAERAAMGDSGRPNLLVGHFPRSGPGARDRYVIEQNVLFENQSDDEPLFQGEGNILFRGNLLYNSHRGPGIFIRPHNDVPKEVRIVANTVVTVGPALILHRPHPMFEQRVERNLFFTDEAQIGWETNLVWPQAEAAFCLADPGPDLPFFDLSPLPGCHTGGFGAVIDP